MPEGSFSLVLHGPTPAFSQDLCDVVVNSAIWYDACEAVGHQEGLDYDNFVLVGDFVTSVKEIIQGRIPVKFEADHPRELWDVATVWR